MHKDKKSKLHLLLLFSRSTTVGSMHTILPLPKHISDTPSACVHGTARACSIAGAFQLSKGTSHEMWLVASSLSSSLVSPIAISNFLFGGPVTMWIGAGYETVEGTDSGSTSYDAIVTNSLSTPTCDIALTPPPLPEHKNFTASRS